MEDNDLIEEVVDAAMTDAGFELLSASDGDADATRFHAVVTDINLGHGPDGWEVGRRAREILPDMPVVYMSGASADEWTSQGVPNRIMVAKPFVPVQIITAVATLLNAADTR